jgi:hypothetical protein
MGIAPSTLEASGHILYGYFLANGATMLGFDSHPDILATHKPVERIFLPIAASAPWSFETIVLLFSAHHRRKVHRDTKADLDQDIASLQDRVLKAARGRISAVMESGDSNDSDVLAFLFLAIVELRFGDKQTGKMHLEAWQRYLIIRREYEVAPCSSTCKVAVWWCVAMLLSDEDSSPGVLEPEMASRIRRDPARLFMCLTPRTSSFG